MRCPELGGSKPRIISVSVVLPEPDSPVIAYWIPALNLRFIPITGKTINYFLPKNLKDDKEAVQHLTLDECFEYVAFATNYKSKKSK